MPLFLSILSGCFTQVLQYIWFVLHIGKVMLNSRINKELSFSFQGLPVYEILSTAHSSFCLQVKPMLNSRTTKNFPLVFKDCKFIHNYAVLYIAYASYR